MMKRLEFAFLIPLLLMLLCAIGFIAFTEAAIDCMAIKDNWPGGNRCGLLKVLFDWQQLVAGLIAIVAAFIGWLAIQDQIAQSSHQDDERIRRTLAGSRAMMPLALSGIGEYAQNAARLLHGAHFLRRRSVLPSSLSDIPTIPFASMDYLRAIVEASSASQGIAVAALLSNLQILSTRLEMLATPRSTVMIDEIESAISLTAELYSRTEALFSFARGEMAFMNERNPTNAELRSAMTLLGFHEPDFDTLKERARSRTPSSWSTRD